MLTSLTLVSSHMRFTQQWLYSAHDSTEKFDIFYVGDHLIVCRQLEADDRSMSVLPSPLNNSQRLSATVSADGIDSIESSHIGTHCTCVLHLVRICPVTTCSSSIAKANSRVLDYQYLNCETLCLCISHVHLFITLHE